MWSVGLLCARARSGAAPARRSATPHFKKTRGRKTNAKNERQMAQVCFALLDKRKRTGDKRSTLKKTRQIKVRPLRTRAFWLPSAPGRRNQRDCRCPCCEPHPLHPARLPITSLRGAPDRRAACRDDTTDGAVSLRRGHMRHCCGHCCESRRPPTPLDPASLSRSPATSHISAPCLALAQHSLILLQ